MRIDGLNFKGLDQSEEAVRGLKYKKLLSLSLAVIYLSLPVVGCGRNEPFHARATSSPIINGHSIIGVWLMNAGSDRIYLIFSEDSAVVSFSKDTIPQTIKWKIENSHLFLEQIGVEGDRGFEECDVVFSEDGGTLTLKSAESAYAGKYTRT